MAVAQFTQLGSVGLPYLAIALSNNQTSTGQLHLLLAVQISGYTAGGTLENLAWRSTPVQAAATSASAVGVLACAGAVGLLILAPNQVSLLTMTVATLCCIALPLVRQKALREFRKSAGAYLGFSIRDFCIRGVGFIPYVLNSVSTNDAEMFFFALYLCGLFFVLLADLGIREYTLWRNCSSQRKCGASKYESLGQDKVCNTKKDIALAVSFSLIGVLLTKPFLAAFTNQIAPAGESKRLIALVIFRGVNIIPFVLKPIVLTRSNNLKPIFPRLSVFLGLLAFLFASLAFSGHSLSALEAAAINGVASGVLVIAVLQLMNDRMSFHLAAFLVPVVLILFFGPVGIATSLMLMAARLKFESNKKRSLPGT